MNKLNTWFSWIQSTAATEKQESKGKANEVWIFLRPMIVDDSYFSMDSEEEEEGEKIVLNVIAMLFQSLCFSGHTEVISFTRKRLWKAKTTWN